MKLIQKQSVAEKEALSLRMNKEGKTAEALLQNLKIMNQKLNAAVSCRDTETLFTERERHYPAHRSVGPDEAHAGIPSGTGCDRNTCSVVVAIIDYIKGAEHEHDGGEQKSDDIDNKNIDKYSLWKYYAEALRAKKEEKAASE